MHSNHQPPADQLNGKPEASSQKHSKVPDVKMLTALLPAASTPKTNMKNKIQPLPPLQPLQPLLHVITPENSSGPSTPSNVTLTKAGILHGGLPIGPIENDIPRTVNSLPMTRAMTSTLPTERNAIAAVQNTSVRRSSSVGARKGSMSKTRTHVGSNGSLRPALALARVSNGRSSVCVLAEEQNHRSRFVLHWNRLYHQRKRHFGCLCIPILDPRSSGKLTWDSLIMLIVLYSAIVVPIEVGFPDLQFGITWSVISTTCDILFLLDVVQNFFVGFYLSDDETMVSDRRLIAKRYLSTWFLLDVLALFPADYLVSAGTSVREKSVISLKLTRMIRLVRVTKLARLIKLRQFAMKVEDVLELDAVITRLTRLISQVLLMTHLLSCFWHLVGYPEDPTDNTWINATGLLESSASVRYLYSLYWAITTVAGVGYGDIHSTNTQERIFAIFTEIIGAVGFGIVIGNITKILENWNREATTRVRKLSMVQEFVKRKAIPKDLKTKLMRYFRHYIAKTSAFDERELLCEFSLSLRGEVLHETYKNSFFLIPAFQRLSSQFVMDMAMYIKPLIAVKGDILAKEKSVGTEMFILNEGIIEVKRTAPNGDWLVVLEILTNHGIFGESSLLNYTLHQNSYTAKATSDLYTLPKEDFDRLIEEFPDAEQTLLIYHQERSELYDRVYEQTVARYHVYLKSQNSDPVSEMIGLENIYPTLTVLLDGELRSYRSVPIPILQNMTLDLSMGVSVFNSVTEKNKMIALLAERTSDKIHWVSCLTQQHLLAPINPDHFVKIAWDVFIGILLLYCAVAIPYEISFLSDDNQEIVAIQTLETVIEVLFALDIVVNFRTAFIDKTGRLVTSNKAIAQRYLRLWFWVDFLSVVPISGIISLCTSSRYSSKTLRLIRSIRLLKIARVLKLVRTVVRVNTTAAARHWTFRIIRLAFKVLFIAHVLTCGYFYTSTMSKDEYGVSLFDNLPTEYTNADKYVYSLYWAVTTMTTVGYGDTSPGNPMEVLYVCFGVLIGASTFAYIVGTVSSLVDEVHMAADTNQERMDRLKAYLKERSIPKPLGARLRRYYEYYLSQRDDENEEAILSALSDNLRSQLVLHLNRDVVKKISFFATQDDACVSYLMGILDPEFCTPGEYVFKEGQVGRHMYFLVKGMAEILFRANTNQELVVATLLEGSYFGEIAMLTMSKRAASIRAKTFISLFVLSRNGLDRINLHYPEMAHNIIQEFRKKIKLIKQTSIKQLSPLIQEDIKQARLRTELFGGGNLSELHKTLEDLETVVERIVAIYGGGDKGKRKALSCVMQYLHKYEFSLDDFLLAAEEVACLRELPLHSSIVAPVAHSSHSSMNLNRLQIQMRRRSSFS